MATTKKTTKTTTKTTKTTAKKTVKKTAEKLDLATFTVTQADLASILGIATSNITPMVQAGLMVKDEDGRFNLRDAVSGYCKRMKDRKEGKQSKSDIDTETAKWKLQNLVAKNRDWRMNRDRQIATEILNKLAGAMMNFREQAKMNPALVTAIDEMLSGIGSVNVDEIPSIIEGGDEEDDE